MTPAAFLERVTSIAQLYDMRASASQWLSDSGIDGLATETVMLVLSETCTNAFLHGRADLVEIEMAIENMDETDGPTITMWMRHDDHDVAALALPTTMPPPEAAFGRGLALVELLVDGMTLSIDPPHIVRRCWLHVNGTARE